MEHQVEAVEAGDIKRGGEINKNEVKDNNADKTFGTLAELKGAQDLIAKNKVRAQEAAASSARIVSITAAVLIALGSLGLGLLIVRDLLRQLGGEPTVAAEAVGAMAQGDLSRTIAVQAHDQTSLLAKLKEMQGSLSGIVATVRNNAESVATASAQIAQGNQDLSHRTEQQPARCSRRRRRWMSWARPWATMPRTRARPISSRWVPPAWRPRAATWSARWWA